MPEVDDPRVLVSSLSGDDAAVYQIADDRVLVATLDFFTPIVDDAYTFGAVAAANALSDLYAMGADPMLALNIVAWPRDPEVLDLVGATLRGSADKVQEAGAFTLGGHSIEDPEPKFGLVALGDARPGTLWTNAGARPGDHLVLTKPLGTGILSTGLKHELIGEPEMAEAIASMTTLNRGAALAAREVADAVHAVTDVTGFGLLGHLHAVLVASGFGARMFARAAPAFDRVDELIGKGAVPGGTERNLEAAAEYADWADGIGDRIRTLLCDAQTSGGLLVAVAPSATDALLDALARHEAPAAAVIGEITRADDARIRVLDSDA